MRKFQLLKYLILFIMVLPLFYEYFKFLPGAAKYILDFLILYYILNYKQSLKIQSSFTRLYLCYVAVICLVTIFSIIIHDESINYFVQEVRRLIIPLLLYYIVSDVFKSYNFAAINLHRFLAFIVFIQIPITVIQTVFYPTFKKLQIFAADRYYLDIATGTLGAGGHSYLGILIPLVFLYTYNFKIFKYSIPFLIPLVLINSGGGVVLFGLIIMLTILYTLLSGPIIHRMRIIAGTAVLIGILISLSQTEFVRQTVRKYTAQYFFYQENYLGAGGRETFVGQDHKISRINGHRFLTRRMDRYDYEHLFGLGFDFKKNVINNRTLSYKSDVNIMIAERGYVGLAAYGIFIVLFLTQIRGMLKKYKYDMVFIKMLFFVTFFIAGFYNQTSRSIIMWLIVICFLVLLEHPTQYKQLSTYLRLKKRKAFSKKGTQLVESPA